MEIVELRALAAERYLTVFSDGQTVKVSTAMIADFSLYSGKDLSEQEQKKLREASRFLGCRERALRIIGARPKSCKELYDSLIQKGETPEDAENCIEWLLERHYLDDGQYASMLVRHYAAKGYGVQKIKNELYRRGIAKSLWDAALEEMPETDDAVYGLLCKKLKGENPDRAQMKKATDALFRRGYSWDEIKAAVSRYQTENSDYN